MKFLAELIKYFTYITTGIIFAFIINVAVVGVESVPVVMIAEIPAAGFVTALITAIIFEKDVKTKKGMFLLCVIHFILLSIVMIVIGLLFEWINRDAQGIILMLLCVAFVYGFTSAVSYFTAKKEADEINAALKNKNN